MTRSFPLLFLAGLAAEVASIIWVGNRLGILATLLLLVAGGVIGVSLIRSAGSSLFAALRSPMQSTALQRGAAGQAVARVGAGVLFLIPGFFTDLLGLLLLLPPVGNWLRSRMPVQSQTWQSPPPERYGAVIDAEAVEITAEVMPPEPPRNSARHPE